jgi:hypothetical protein
MTPGSHLKCGRENRHVKAPETLATPLTLWYISATDDPNADPEPVITGAIGDERD